MFNKKGMEIAVGTVVGLVLGGLMLFAGIALLGSIVSKSNQTHEQLLINMEEDIIKAFDRNDPIYIHRNPLEVRPRQDVVIFGVGVHNIYNTTRNFTMNITPSGAFILPDGQQVAVSHGPSTPMILNPREKGVGFVIVPVSALGKGQHSLTLNVSHHNGTHTVLHDTRKILYVTR